jgi:hypothetical protein
MHEAPHQRYASAGGQVALKQVKIYTTIDIRWKSPPLIKILPRLPSYFDSYPLLEPLHVEYDRNCRASSKYYHTG